MKTTATKKTTRQRPKREFNIGTSGQFRTLAMFEYQLDNNGAISCEWDCMAKRDEFYCHGSYHDCVNIGECWFYQGGDQGTGLLDSLTKEVVKNKDAIVKTASNTLNLNVSFDNTFFIRIS